jgi:pimeloyl-ACP methyl ester carboxylesterase
MESFRVRSAGANIACVRAGSGSPLLLAHPLFFSKAYWALEVFAGRFDVVAIDQRGHGETEADEIAPEAMAEDLRAVLDHLGWERAALGGTSLGSTTTLLFALRHPERAALLVLDLPSFGRGKGRDPARAERTAAALERGDLEGAAGHILEGLSEPRARAWREALMSDWRNYDPARLGPKLARAMRSNARWKVLERWPEELSEVSAPTRILALKGDPTHPWEVAETLARTIPGARLVPRVPSLSPPAIARQWLEVLGSG